MDVIEGLREAELAARHLQDACALVSEAGWNQTEADWRMMMRLGHAIGLEDSSGRLVASALTMPYGNAFGWVSMVLVTSTWRRRGLATRLLDTCIAEHEAAGRTPVLDATPAGEAVYRRLGFAEHFPLQRWERAGADGRAASAARPLDAAEIDRIVALDRTVFGGDRGDVLRDIAARSDGGGWCLEDGRGYLLTRSGRIARQLGPLCATDDAAAATLLSAALDAVDGPVFVDVPDRHEALTGLLKASGFTPQRPLRRMFKGGNGGFGDVARMYALAGPELG